MMATNSCTADLPVSSGIPNFGADRTEVERPPPSLERAEYVKLRAWGLRSLRRPAKRSGPRSVSDLPVWQDLKNQKTAPEKNQKWYTIPYQYHTTGGGYPLWGWGLRS